MLTYHPTSKRVRGGFVPMVTVRGARGRMLGSGTPKGEAREFRTFTTAEAAHAEARAIALKVAANLQHQFVNVSVAA